MIKDIQATVTLGIECSLGSDGLSVGIGKSCAYGCYEKMENNREMIIALVAAGSAAWIASGIVSNFLNLFYFMIPGVTLFKIN